MVKIGNIKTRKAKQATSNAVTTVDFSRKNATRNSRVTINPLSESPGIGVPWIAAIRITISESHVARAWYEAALW